MYFQIEGGVVFVCSKLKLKSTLFALPHPRAKHVACHWQLIPDMRFESLGSVPLPPSTCLFDTQQLDPLNLVCPRSRTKGEMYKRRILTSLFLPHLTFSPSSPSYSSVASGYPP